MSSFQTLVNLLLFPFRLLWNIFVIAGTIFLEITWIGFIFGSVVGVILLLIFWVEGFGFPLLLLVFTTSLWPEEEVTKPALASTEDGRANGSQDTNIVEGKAGGFEIGAIDHLKRIAIGTLAGIALIAFLIFIDSLKH